MFLLPNENQPLVQAGLAPAGLAPADQARCLAAEPMVVVHRNRRALDHLEEPASLVAELALPGRVLRLPNGM